MSELITITTPLRLFKGHEYRITAVAVFPDKRRMVTGSDDTTLRLWDLKTGVVLKKMEGHRKGVWRLAVSRDGQLIASGDQGGKVIVWHGDTGELLTKIEAHSYLISSLYFSPNGTVLATGSYVENMTRLWNTKTWQLQGDPIECGRVRCIRHSPSGELLAIAIDDIAIDDNIQIYNSGTRKRVTSFEAHKSLNLSLTWTPDGTRLLTGGNSTDPTIREWDTTTWKQVGDPWTGHTDHIRAIAIHPAGTLVASASSDNHVHLWQLSDRRTIAVFKHSLASLCVTFSADGNHIFSGGNDKTISEWTVPKGIHPKILAITTSRIACLNGDLSTAEELLTQDINTSPNNHTSYAHRSFVMARKYDWDRALLDAIKSIGIQPSLTGYISKGIALCGKGRVLDARAAFDVASMYTDQDSEITHFLLLTKAIALFNADQHDEANLLLKELAAGCPNADTLACGIVQAYLHVQLGIKALDGAHYDEAADYFTAALDSRDSSSKSNIHEKYEDLMVLFGWDLKSLWRKAHHKRCDALLRAGKLQDAVKSYQHMMTSDDEITKADCLDWSNDFKQECSALCAANGEAAFAASDYDKAIDLYSMAIDLDYASDVVFANRSEAKLSKMLWEEALLDAQKVTELNPSSHVGYQLSHSALRGAQRYDEAIKAFTIMLSKLDDASEAQIRGMRDAREKLQWASKCVTTMQEDIAYTLFGIFGVHLPVIYGEKKQNALGRLLQEIVARSGDITSLDWVGQSSEFNSCLPADIISYAAPPCSLPSLSEDEIQTAVSSLRNIVPVDSASNLYNLLKNMNAPLFASCRLCLPCIAFRVTEVKRRRGVASHSTYGVKADGLRDLLITTDKTLIQFSRARPTQQAFFLVRPWDRRLLGLPDFSEQLTFADEEESVGDWSESQSGLDDTDESSSDSPGEEELSIDSDVHSRSLRLMVHLGQAFSALLVAQQRVGEYKRVASDQYIIAQMKDPASIDIMSIRTLDIL